MGKDSMLKLFLDDARSQGKSLRQYCKDMGIDYYDLTGFPNPLKTVSIDEVENDASTASKSRSDSDL
jgi:5'-3' exonuclease